ncbi:MAG: hypothetical protein ACLUPV_11125 [Bilophila wadsworthia]
MSDIGMGYGEMQVANLCKGYGIGPLHKEVIKDCSFTLKKQAHRPHRAVGLRQVGAHQHAGGL